MARETRDDWPPRLLQKDAESAFVASRLKGPSHLIFLGFTPIAFVQRDGTCKAAGGILYRSYLLLAFAVTLAFLARQQGDV